MLNQELCDPYGITVSFDQTPQIRREAMIRKGLFLQPR